VQQENGQLLQLENEDKARLRPAAESFPSMCDPMVVTEEGVLGLSARGQLLLGGRQDDTADPPEAAGRSRSRSSWRTG
jgi:hypothetical protein